MGWLLDMGSSFQDGGLVQDTGCVVYSRRQYQTCEKTVSSNLLYKNISISLHILSVAQGIIFLIELENSSL